MLERLGVRDDLLVHELPDRGQDLLLHVGQSGGLRETGQGDLLCFGRWSGRAGAGSSGGSAGARVRSRDDASVAQPPQLSRGEAEHLAEDLPGLAAKDRWLPRLTVSAVPAQRRAGGDRRGRCGRCAGLVKLDVGEDRVSAPPVGGGDVGHPPVPAPERPRAVELGADLADVTRGEPGRDDGGDCLPMAVPLLLPAQVDVERGLQRLEDLGRPGCLLQGSPLAFGQGHHHHPLAVAAGEVGTEAAVEVVALPRSVRAAQLRLRQPAEVGHPGQRHVGEGELDEGAAPGPLPVVQRGQHPGRHADAGDEVPGGEHVVHWRADPLGPGDLREADLGVDRVVDGRAAVGVPLDAQVDQVRPPGFEGLVRQPLPPHHVVDEQPAVRPGGGDQRDHELAALGAAHIDRDRALALVQRCPVVALAARRDRPAAVVVTTAERVDPRDFRAQLGQRQAAGRAGDVARALDDLQAAKGQLSS